MLEQFQCSEPEESVDRGNPLFCKDDGVEPSSSEKAAMLVYRGRGPPFLPAARKDTVDNEQQASSIPPHPL